MENLDDYTASRADALLDDLFNHETWDFEPIPGLLGWRDDTEFRPFASRLYDLLGRPRLAKRQWCDDGGTWRYSKAICVDRAAFARHLLGDVTYAFSCVRKFEALFIVWDLDRFFWQRLDVMREVLERRGLAAGAFGIEGSAIDRGKVVLTLAQPIPQAQARRIALDVLGEASGNMLFGATDDVTVFPNGGKDAGNVVRIFGTNRKRTTAIGEAALDLHGWPSDLAGIVPAQVALESFAGASLPTIYPGEDGGEKEAPRNFRERVAAMLAEPYTGNGQSTGADLLRLANAAVLEDAPNAAAILDAMCDQIVAQSPNMSSGARENLQRKTARASALARVLANPPTTRPDMLGDWKPLDRAGMKMVGFSKLTKGAERVYRAAADLVLRLRLQPHAFTIGYGQWAALAGYTDKSTCRRAVDEAERAGLLFRMDRGESKPGGLVTMVTLVGAGETLQHAYDASLASHTYRCRVIERMKRGLPPSPGFVASGKLCFEKKIGAPTIFGSGVERAA